MLVLKTEELENHAGAFSQTPSPLRGFTSSALLWETKVSVVANNAYYALSLLAKRESFFRFLSLEKVTWKVPPLG